MRNDSVDSKINAALNRRDRERRENNKHVVTIIIGTVLLIPLVFFAVIAFADEPEESSPKS